MGAWGCAARPLHCACGWCTTLVCGVYRYSSCDACVSYTRHYQRPSATRLCYSTYLVQLAPSSSVPTPLLLSSFGPFSCCFACSIIVHHLHESALHSTPSHLQLLTLGHAVSAEIQSTARFCHL